MEKTRCDGFVFSIDRLLKPSPDRGIVQSQLSNLDSRQEAFGVRMSSWVWFMKRPWRVPVERRALGPAVLPRNRRSTKETSLPEVLNTTRSKRLWEESSCLSLACWANWLTTCSSDLSHATLCRARGYRASFYLWAYDNHVITSLVCGRSEGALATQFEFSFPREIDIG